MAQLAERSPAEWLPGTAPLVLPVAGDTRLLQVLHKLRLLALRRLLTLEGGRVPKALRAPLGRLQAALTQWVGSAPRVVVSAIGTSDVLCSLLALESQAVSAEQALSAAVPALLAALCALGFKPSATLLWDVPLRRLLDPARGRVVDFEPAAQGLTYDALGIELLLADGAHVRHDTPARPGVDVQQPFHRFDPELPACLSLIDSNPLAMLEAHPEKQGNRLDLGEREPAVWCQALAEAVSLVRLALPALATELGASLARVVPVGYEPERHLSASYREAPGLIYLTLHPSRLTLAEAVIHETQHGKLNALTWLDPIMKNGHSEWTQSPVRPDLRPLMGVLLAVHAFAPVAMLHRRLAELGHPLSQTPEFASRRAEVLAQNAQALTTLAARADFSELGTRVFAGLSALHAEAGAT